MKLKVLRAAYSKKGWRLRFCDTMTKMVTTVVVNQSLPDALELGAVEAAENIYEMIKFNKAQRGR